MRTSALKAVADTHHLAHAAVVDSKLIKPPSRGVNPQRKPTTTYTPPRLRVKSRIKSATGTVTAKATPTTPDSLPEVVDASQTNAQNILKHSIDPSTISVQDYSPPKNAEPPILEHGLDRVLFNPGVVRTQCPRTGVHNFVSSLKKIPPISRFKPELLPPYVTPFHDKNLRKAFSEHKDKVKYLGATSTTTAALQHMHFLISKWRPLNHEMLSKSLTLANVHPTRAHSAPTSVVLKPAGDQQWVVNSDFDFSNSNSELMQVGHMLELKLTVSPEEFDKYLTKEDTSDGQAEQKEIEESNKPVESSEHSYNYAKIGSFLVRSQLDARHPRLSTTGGQGYFDIKTRAVLAVRMDPLDRYYDARNYNITKSTGEWSSFEREMYDLSRTMLLKYSLQARIGQMDGIFIAHHNLNDILGFQFLSFADMDEILHGQRDEESQDIYSGLGGQEFKLSFIMLEQIFDTIAEKLPGQDIWCHLDSAGPKSAPYLNVFAERVTPTLLEEIDEAKKTYASSTGTTKISSPDAIKDDEISLPFSLQKQVNAMSSTAAMLNEELERHKAAYHANKNSPTPKKLSQMVGQYIGLAAQYKRTASDMEQSETHDVALANSLQAIKTTILNIESFAQSLPADLQKDAWAKGQELVSSKDTLETPFHWRHQPTELVGFTIKLQNFVNGQPVNRPNKLQSTDRWTAEYSIEAMTDNDLDTAYRKMLQKKMLLKDWSQVMKLYESSFHKSIMKHSENGRVWDEALQQKADANTLRHQSTVSSQTALDSLGVHFDSTAHLRLKPERAENVEDVRTTVAGV